MSGRKSRMSVLGGVLVLAGLAGCFDGMGGPDKETQAKAIQACKGEAQAMFQTSAQRPVSVEFPTARMEPDRPASGESLYVQVEMVSRFEDGTTKSHKIACTIVARGGSVQMSGMSTWF